MKSKFTELYNQMLVSEAADESYTISYTDPITKQPATKVITLPAGITNPKLEKGLKAPVASTATVGVK